MRLSLFEGMGKGHAESGFISGADDAGHRFHANVVARVGTRAPRPARDRPET